MKILFLSRDNISLGSYRIWVHDLNTYFRDCGYQSDIATNKTNILDYDVIICGKNDVTTAVKVKGMHPNKKVGVINLAANAKNLPIDFVIVGSIEEMDSLSHYKNVFLFPLIENMYQGASDYKTHDNKPKLRIGFHGHYPHLSKFEPNLKRAIEEVDKMCEIELFIVTSNSSFDWKVGKPNIKNITMKPWNIDTIKDDILSCDIGIVPNVTNLLLDLSIYPTSVDFGLNDTDILIRMKNKSNAGRAFVFHQLGIPVIADLTPSNFHIMGNPECGIIANSHEGWKKGILRLRDSRLRQKMADRAKREFDRLYSPCAWASKLYNDILGIIYE
jgi:glycosyltransferase involved in cell wall biosynthesis